MDQETAQRYQRMAMQKTEKKPVKQRRGISGSTLKMIALVTMLIDHIGAGILGRYLSMYGINSLDTSQAEAVEQWMAQYGSLYSTYVIMRMIGRLAFPIYCFLLVEGFTHTKNQLQYANRLLLFAAISEVPFDLMVKGKILEFEHQNVFFTLFLGLMAMYGIQWAEEHEVWGNFKKQLCKFAVTIACMAVAQMITTDYAAIGVLCITALYLFRKKKLYQVMAGCIAFSWEMTAPLAFIPIWFYNGKRGWNLKYFFYLFYPVHLLLLYLVCVALGVSAYPAG